LRVNQKLCEIVGYGREELLTKTFQEITHPADLESDLARVRRILVGELETYSIEKRYVHKDGSFVPINLTVALVRDEANQPAYFISVVEDVSSRVRAEEEKERLRAQLQQSQKMEAVGRLAGGVAHDFNNLLSIIISNSSFALESMEPGHPSRDDIEEIRTAGARAATLTRQLLSFSRQQVLRPQILDLNDLIRALNRMMGRFLGEDIHIVLQLDPRLGLVRADPGQLEQVILNLAINARDAMPDGGQLLIETENVEPDGRNRERHVDGGGGPLVRVSVSDTGCGMDAETQAKVFEPFFTTKGRDKGTGLGLASVYGIVKQSNGFVWVSSRPGHGSTFQIELPREVSVEQPWKPGAVPGTLQGGGETVLIVEDSAEVRAVAVRSLRALGYRVMEADGLASARRVAGSVPILQLLVTDMVMPGGSGRDVGKAVKAAHPGVKIIYMSGYTDSAFTNQGVLGPGVTFLQKPLTPELLGRRARQVLDGSGSA
jgi:PAS domain S-box-containing protein